MVVLLDKLALGWVAAKSVSTMFWSIMLEWLMWTIDWRVLSPKLHYSAVATSGWVGKVEGYLVSSSIIWCSLQLSTYWLAGRCMTLILLVFTWAFCCGATPVQLFSLSAKSLAPPIVA